MCSAKGKATRKRRDIVFSYNSLNIDVVLDISADDNRERERERERERTGVHTQELNVGGKKSAARVSHHLEQISKTEMENAEEECGAGCVQLYRDSLRTNFM